VRSAGLPLPVRLPAAVHPSLKHQYGALTTSLLASWAELGVEVTVATKNMSEYLESWNDTTGFDLFVGRWIADYEDPDNFTFTLFHSENGRLRRYFSSPETDEILEEARRESRAGVREGLYRKFENLLLESGVLVPLFHDVDYRIAAPSVKGIVLRSTAPFINYTEVGKASAGTPTAVPARSSVEGVLHVPIAGVVRSLDPCLTETVEQAEVLPNLYETLTRQGESAVVVPWLASEFTTENDGMRFRFRLRPGVRFHDALRRELAGRRRRHRPVSGGCFRAGPTARARAQPELLARGLPEERGDRLSLRGSAGGDPLRFPGGKALGRLRSPPRGRGSPA